jgi:chlorite dismutase
MIVSVIMLRRYSNMWVGSDSGRRGTCVDGDRVLQLVTRSTGLDDFEWGVTLFAVAPDDLKACVYPMRYDRASAHFAEFGPFVTGVVGPLDEVLAAVSVR